VRDVRAAKMFVRAGREHVQEWLGFLLGHAQLFGIVPVFQADLTLEENVRNLRDAGKVNAKATGLRWCQGDYLYHQNTGLLLLAAREKDRKAFIAYLDGIRERFHQRAYVLIENGNAALVTAEGRTPLATTFAGSLASLDELAGHLIPGWTTQGNFDRSMSYVQMRDYQTRPRPGEGESSTP
jgi:hypothetical protein